MAWVMLKDASDWKKHCDVVRAQWGIDSFNGVSFGKGPQSYPALAATLVVPQSPSPIIKTAFVYEADARRLLGDAEEPPRTFSTKIDWAESSRRSILANLMAVAYFLRETGICTAAAYEARYNEALSIVDEVATQENAKTVAAHLRSEGRPQEADIIERTAPPGD